MTQVIPAQCQLGTLAQPCLFVWEVGLEVERHSPVGGQGEARKTQKEE